LLFAAEPTPTELKACGAFLETQAKAFRTGGDKAWQEAVKKRPDAPQRRALASLCQTLLCSNRFLYVD
jgi:hypothetical protein